MFLAKGSLHEQLEGNVFLAAGKECLYEVCDETASWRLMYIGPFMEIIGNYSSIFFVVLSHIYIYTYICFPLLAQMQVAVPYTILSSGNVKVYTGRGCKV